MRQADSSTVAARPTDRYRSWRALRVAAYSLLIALAIAASGLRYGLLHLDYWHQTLDQALSTAIGGTVSVQAYQGRWGAAGPVLIINDLHLDSPAAFSFSATQLRVELNLWQSLRHARWQFEGFALSEAHLRIHTSSASSSSFSFADLRRRLQQFNHLDIQRSTVDLHLPGGDPATLAITQLLGSRSATQQRASAEIHLIRSGQDYGTLQLRLQGDGRGKKGQLWLHSAAMELAPWLQPVIAADARLHQAKMGFSLWLPWRDETVQSATWQLHQADLHWTLAAVNHRWQAEDVTGRFVRTAEGWSAALAAPGRLRTDAQVWPTSALTGYWLPATARQPAQLRVRTGPLRIEQIAPLIALLSAHSSATSDWQPTGVIRYLALDIPLQKPAESRFAVEFEAVSWRAQHHAPGLRGFNGRAAGSTRRARIQLAGHDGVVYAPANFPQPLILSQYQGVIDWQRSDRQTQLIGRDLRLRSASLQLNGDFSWRKEEEAPPWLNMLARIQAKDVRDIPNYLPQPYVNATVQHYLREALRGGEVSEGTLVFAGSPSQFPFSHNEGRFEVWVPLRQATYQFQSGWPALTRLAADLDFVNDGLTIRASQAQLGNVTARNIQATIVHYQQQQLLIDADLAGSGREVGNYFARTPLRKSVGETLQRTLQVQGKVNGDLHLAIPLNHGQVRATGAVRLQGNTVSVPALNTTLQNVSGVFHYDNSTLHSDLLHARWRGQPVSLRFRSRQQATERQIAVALAGRWRAEQVHDLPAAFTASLNGPVDWHSNVAVTLPADGPARYHGDLALDLVQVSSCLPAPLTKSRGKPLRLQARFNGDPDTVFVQGQLGEQVFNSQWRLAALPVPQKAVWRQDPRGRIPALPPQASVELALPPVDGDSWLRLYQQLPASPQSAWRWPGRFTLSTPQLQWGGQPWHQLRVQGQSLWTGVRLVAHAQELDGELRYRPHAPWQIALNRLDYQPSGDTAGKRPALLHDVTPLKPLPALNIRCLKCRLGTLPVSEIRGELRSAPGRWLLRNGMLKNSAAELHVEGVWSGNTVRNQTRVQGSIQGSNLGRTLTLLGLTVPLQGSPYTVRYALSWPAAPWSPTLAALSGEVTGRLGRGRLNGVDSGNAGRLLRVFTLRGLRRRLQLDFRDVFSKNFYYDRIRSTLTIDHGTITHAAATVNGLEADIVVNGQLDLKRQQLNLQADVYPGLLMPASLAAALAVNPLAGAAIFTAGNVLRPLWREMARFHYRISGDLHHPVIRHQ